MRFSYTGFSVLLIIMCITIQHKSVEAKPFIFKFFVPQAPARTDSSPASTSSTSYSTGIDFTSILNTKLNILSSLLRTGISGGFNFGFKKFLPNIQSTSTRKPFTSTTTSSPDAEFQPESSTKSITSSTTTMTTESAQVVNGATKGTTKSNGIDNTVFETTTAKSVISGYNYNIAADAIDVNGNSKLTANDNYYDSSAATVTNNAQNEYEASTPDTDSKSDISNNTMNENEISNEIMMISSQYLPSF